MGGGASRRRVTAPSSPPLPIMDTSGRRRTLEGHGQRERRGPRASLRRAREPGLTSRRRVTAPSSPPLSTVDTSGRRRTLERRGPRSNPQRPRRSGPASRLRVTAPSSSLLFVLETSGPTSTHHHHHHHSLAAKNRSRRGVLQLGERLHCGLGENCGDVSPRRRYDPYTSRRPRAHRSKRPRVRPRLFLSSLAPGVTRPR